LVSTVAITKAPTARPIPAWGEAPGTPNLNPQGLKARPIEASFPYIPLVPFDSIFLQQSSEFILKRMHPVMRLLRLDIPNQRLQISRPDGKRTIAALPCEPRQDRRFRLQPTRRRSLHSFHQFRDGHRPRQPNREMQMVGNAANAIAFASSISYQCGQIKIKFQTYSLIQNRRTILRAEDYMNQNKRERLSHRADYRSGLQPSRFRPCPSWGFAPCWYSSAPSALRTRQSIPHEVPHHA
jgi:hypothetical protein